MSVETSNKHDHQEWHLRHIKDILLKTKYKKNMSRYCTLYIYISQLRQVFILLSFKRKSALFILLTSAVLTTCNSVVDTIRSFASDMSPLFRAIRRHCVSLLLALGSLA